MVEWSDGYITSIDYTSGFYHGLSPVAQNFSLLLRGIEPLQLKDGFSYCELGCGHGFSTNLLAAANPNGAFWGIDFNPAHISSAQRLAAAARIENITFLEQSFADVVTSDMPRLEFIALHGVWSWISSENRRAIIDIINAKLKPGGVVYISYNALPGWAAHAPLRQLLVERLRGKTDPTPEAINEALHFAAQVRETGAAYFSSNPHTAQRLEAIRSASRNYVAHEYFNRHWSPSYHSDVASELSAAKLAFGAPSDVAEHFDQLLLPSAARDLLRDLTPSARETVIDYYLNRQFRRDVFVRGARQLSEREREERLLATRFASIAPQPAYPFKVRFPLGEVTLDESPYKVILGALAAGPLSLGELLTKPAVSALGLQAVFQALVMSIAARLLAPAHGPEGEEEARRKHAGYFNEAVLSRLGGERQEQTLASSVLGTGVVIPPVDQLFLQTNAMDPATPVDRAIETITARHQQLRKKGKPVTSPEETRNELEATLNDFRQIRFAIYKQLGVVPSAPGVLNK